MNSATPFAPANTALGRRCLHILYADDLPELRDVARTAFLHDGHDIECVANGLLALNRLAMKPDFDLVVTDHNMPRMNGLEFVARLRAMKFPGKIVVLSSEPGEILLSKYARLKVDRILCKPVYPAELRQVAIDLFNPATRPA